MTCIRKLPSGFDRTIPDRWVCILFNPDDTEVAWIDPEMQLIYQVSYRRDYINHEMLPPFLTVSAVQTYG